MKTTKRKRSFDIKFNHFGEELQRALGGKFERQRSGKVKSVKGNENKLSRTTASAS